MPWHTEWHNAAESILYVYGTNPWGWEELTSQALNWQEEVSTKPHKVHVIINAEGDLKMPEISTITAEWVPPWMPIRDIFMKAPANHGLVVLVAAPLFVESIVANVQRLVKDQVETDHIRYAKSIVEAEQIIAAESD